MPGTYLLSTRDYIIGSVSYNISILSLVFIVEGVGSYRVELEQRLKDSQVTSVHKFLYDFGAFDDALEFAKALEDSFSELESTLGA